MFHISLVRPWRQQYHLYNVSHFTSKTMETAITSKKRLNFDTGIYTKSDLLTFIQTVSIYLMTAITSLMLNLDSAVYTFSQTRLLFKQWVDMYIHACLHTLYMWVRVCFMLPSSWHLSWKSLTCRKKSGSRGRRKAHLPWDYITMPSQQ